MMENDVRLTRFPRVSLLAAALVMGVAACSSNAPEASATAAPAPSAHPESGLPVIPLTVTTAGGKTHTFRVEVASTPAQQEKGLMFRTALGPDEGMIFPENPPRRAAFWMRNTVIPLDIIYIGTDGRVLNIYANTVPYDETPLPSAGVASGVLELAGGRAAELGIAAGDRVKW